MKFAIIVLLTCVSLSQAFHSWGIFKKWKDAAAESIDTSGSEEHAQRFLDEVANTGQEMMNEEHHRNKVGKVWMKFQNKAKETLENAKETIDEVEQELNLTEGVPDHAREVIKEVRQQTREIVKSLKKIIRPELLSGLQGEIPEIFEPKSTAEPEVLPTELLEPTAEPEFLATELPEMVTEEPEPEVTEEPETEFSTEEPEATEEPETEFSTEEPEPEVTEEPYVLPTEEPVESTTVPEVDNNDDDDDDDDDDDIAPVNYEDDDDDDADDDDDEQIGENTSEVRPVPQEEEVANEEEIHEIVDVAPQAVEVEEKQVMPKWLSKRQNKLRRLWQKYTLHNKEKVLQKIRKLESKLTKMSEEDNEE